MSVVESKAFISERHTKYAEKAWNETFQLVRRYMDKSRGDTKPCELIWCLKGLHEALKVSSLSAMVSQLEMIAKQRGMGSHLSHIETTYYLTADMFYLEVLLLPGGGVDNVKVAQHGEALMVVDSGISIVFIRKVFSTNFTLSHKVKRVSIQLLRSKKFEEFSVKLEDLFSLYNIPGDNETKIKVYTALQCLGKDLQKISHLPRPLGQYNVQVDMILNGRIGYLTGGIEGSSMTIQYYISPSDILLELSDSERDCVDQVALVIVGPTDCTYKLQMASLIPQPPQIDAHGLPLFIPLCDVPSEMASACFQLKLHPPLPMFRFFIKMLREITDIAVADADLQWAPFPRLLWMLLREKRDNQTPLPGREMHSYVFPGAAWNQAALKGALVCTIPFTHPAHVPPLLELLRHQCAINTLLASCITSHRPSPVLVNVSDSRRLTCSLFEAGSEDRSMNEYISEVLKRCMSFPVTMRALKGRLAKRRGGISIPACSFTVSGGDENTASVPLLCETDNNPASGPGLETDDIPTTQSTPSVFSQDAMELNATPMEAELAYCMSVGTSACYRSQYKASYQPLSLCFCGCVFTLDG